MFTQEEINAFSGGYKLSSSGVVTLVGSPLHSFLRNVISFPVTLSLNALVKKGVLVEWSGVNWIEFPFKYSKLNGQWYDPVTIATNIAIQRGWKNPPNILVQEDLTFETAIGYYTAFVDLILQSYATVNEQTLNTSELVQLSGEIQDRIRGEHFSYETIARQYGKENNLLLYDLKTGAYRSELISFEPYSLYLIRENFIAPNTNFEKFRPGFAKFKQQRMENSSKNKLNYPYVGYLTHYELENEKYPAIIDALNRNDTQDFLAGVTELSQSVGYNLGTLSEFQKIIGKMLEKLGLKLYLFNVGEYSGSILLFADALQIEAFKENIIREYYNLTNRTIRLEELQIFNGFNKEPIRT